MQKFICSGIPKSGTTFLQRALNYHPEINCPPEHDFRKLLIGLNELAISYNKRLSLISREMGLEPSMFKESFVVDTFYEIINKFLDVNEKKIKASGLNDNNFTIRNARQILENLDVKILFIIRNPIDTALSQWDHKLRIYKSRFEGKEIEPLIFDGKLDRDKFVIQQSKDWNYLTKSLHDLAIMFPEDVRIITYEDLKLETRKTLESILIFLGLKINKKNIDQVIQLSSLEKMRQNSSNKEFYKTARINWGSNEIPKSTMSNSLYYCSELLNIYYPKH